MPTLCEIQKSFVRFLFDGDNEAVRPFIRAGKLSVDERLKIYRNNIYSCLRDHLRSTYPVIERLVGDDFFQAAADQFIRQSPSKSGDVHQYGKCFSEFLAGFPPTAELSYLEDIAKLEWALHEVFYAADPPPLDWTRFNAIPVTAYGSLQFKLNPAVRLIQSPYPIFDIWESNQPGFEGNTTIHLDAGGVKLVILRPHYKALPKPLTSTEWFVLTSFSKGLSLSETADLLTDKDKDHNFGAILKQLMAYNIVTDFSFP